jgi:hypothetical protein
VRSIKCPCCVYRALYNKPWPDDWHIQTVMGLTDIKGRTIYLADGMSPTDNFETLLHEFCHMEGKDRHDGEFDREMNKLVTKAARLGLRWEGIQE